MVAGRAPDESVVFSQELLAKLDTLPENAQAVSHLFKQGRLPVPRDHLEALADITKGLVVGSSGKLANFLSNKIQNGGLLNATGKLVLLVAHMANALFKSQAHCAQILLLLRISFKPLLIQPLFDTVTSVQQCYWKQPVPAQGKTKK